MSGPHRLTLDHGRGSTVIWLGSDAVQAAAPELATWLDGRLVFVLTTPTVRSLHGAALEPLLGPAGAVEFIEVAEGEAAKRLTELEAVWSRLLELGGKRDSRVLTFGGGSVGDLGGFAAATFLRGIECAHVPTTLLAQVDAAIGGKTGVNLPQGKNTVGAFHHPHMVISDSRFLSTLPESELRSGLFEVIKVGLVADPALVTTCERDLERLMAGEPSALAPVVAAAAVAKVGVVEGDPGETSRRMLLNFGHTLGHAIEAVLGYDGPRHGEAVGYGMLFALGLSVERGLAEDEAERAVGLIRRLDLPLLPMLEPDELLQAIGRDKKARREGISWVLLEGLGRGVVTADWDPAVVRSELATFLSKTVESRRRPGGAAQSV